MRTKSIIVTETQALDPSEADIFDLVPAGGIAWLMPAHEVGKEVIIRVLPRKKNGTVHVTDFENVTGMSINAHSSHYDAFSPYDDTRFLFPNGRTWKSLEIGPLVEIVADPDTGVPKSVNTGRSPTFIRLQWTGRDWLIIAATSALQRPEQLDHPIFGPTDPLRQAPEDADLTREGEQQAEAQTEAQPS